METDRPSKMTRFSNKPSTTRPEGRPQVKKNHYTTVKMASCRICSRESSGYHFGVVTCEACKAFFRRAIGRGSKVSDSCRQGDFQCGENPAKITGCPTCRLQRCKDLGMSKGGARKGRYSLQLRTQSILDAKKEQEHLQNVKQEKLLLELPAASFDDGSTSNNWWQTSPEDTGRLRENWALTDTSQYSWGLSVSPEDQVDFQTSFGDVTNDHEMLVDDNVGAISTTHQLNNDVIDVHIHDTQTFDVYQRHKITTKTHDVTKACNVSKIHDVYDVTRTTNDATTSNTKEAMPLIPAEDSQNYEMLINELVKLREHLFPHENDTENILQRQKEIEEEHIQREEAYQFMFGSTRTNYVSSTEFNEVLTEINIELDERLKVLRTKAIDNEKNIVNYIQHSRYIPGFETLDLDDMLALLKASYYEFWLLSNFVYFNQERSVTGGSGTVINAHKKIICSLFPKEYVDATFLYTETLKKLNLSLEEVAIIRVILLTFTDRCTLKYPRRVEKLQNLFVKCLIFQITKTHDNYRPRFCQIIERLVEIRELSHMNVSVNEKFTKDWAAMLADFPLWREMISPAPSVEQGVDVDDC